MDMLKYLKDLSGLLYLVQTTHFLVPILKIFDSFSSTVYHDKYLLSEGGFNYTGKNDISPYFSL